jgi:predicted NUDIX family phosphoesterase/dephospho-CoA kinase
MRARLSEHIRKLKNDSTFIRTKANRFGLRDWLDNGKFKEYVSKPFEKDKQKEIVVCIKQSLVDKHKRFFGFHESYSSYLKELSIPDNLVILPRGEAKTRDDLKQLVSYVILKDKKGKILSFIRGNYGQKESLLKGVLCLGFGGHVNQFDLDLFSIQDGGIVNSAYREIGEEIKGLKISNLKFIGVINDDSSPLGLNHFAFVFQASLPVNFKLSEFSREMSVNKLSLLNNSEVWNRFHELEFWSQLLVKKYLKRPKNHEPVFIKTKNIVFNCSPLIIVGEIGSGKSEVARHIAKKFSLPLISTRKCVELLINIEDFNTKNRSIFQDEAIKLVSTPEGIKKLADKIIEEMHVFKNSCMIIDGVRNLETYNILKSHYPNANLLYIDLPRDSAYKMYSSRSDRRKVNIHEFRTARHHDVEKEITLFKTRADAYLFNGGNLNDLYKSINKWWNERNNS